MDIPTRWPLGAKVVWLGGTTAEDAVVVGRSFKEVWHYDLRLGDGRVMPNVTETTFRTAANDNAHNG